MVETISPLAMKKQTISLRNRKVQVEPVIRDTELWMTFSRQCSAIIEQRGEKT